MGEKRPIPIATEDYESVRKRIFEESPEAYALWKQTEAKRDISMMLVRLRKSANLSQKDVAERTGWDKAFVSRLEAAQGAIPDAHTLARYAQACEAELAYVVGKRSGGEKIRIIDAITLHHDRPTEPQGVFERLRNHQLDVSEN